MKRRSIVNISKFLSDDRKYFDFKFIKYNVLI